MQGQCKPNAESSLFAEAQPVFANFLQSYDEKAQNPSAENAEICAESSKMLHFNTGIIQNVPFQRNLHLFLYFRRDIHYFLGTLGKRYYLCHKFQLQSFQYKLQSLQYRYPSPTPHQASPTKVPVLISFGCAESEQSLQNAPFHRVLERFSSFLARYSLGVMPKNRLKARPNAPWSS